MQRKTAVILIVALLCTMTIISTYEFLRVNNERFMLDATYNWHKCTWVDGTAVHSYDTITIRTSLLVQAYAILGHYRVNGYPLWLDVSDWSQGLHLKIADSYYVVDKVSLYWKAHQSGVDLYYDGESGLLVRVYIDRTSNPHFWPTEYYIDITLGANNLGELASYISGRYLIYDNLLIIGIFAELAIINWLVMKRKNSKRKGAESSNSYPTANSLSIFK